MLKRLRLAISFLTLLPVRPPAAAASPERVTESAVFFPLTGWLIGLVLAGSAWGVDTLHLAPSVGAVLLVGLEAWLTRGLHLDGIADLFDALGGGFTAERRLAIMKDSAIGTFGVTGLFLVLFLKAASLAVLLAWQEPGRFLLLAGVPAAARWAMVGLACGSRYPRESGTGHAFVGRVRARHLLVAGLTLLPIFWAGPAGILALLATQMPALWFRWKAHAALGGVTGDVLGASCELGEAAGWLGLAFWIGSGLAG